MNVPDEVMDDRLTVYLAGEASAATRALIESHARQNPAFASKLEAVGTLSLGGELPRERSRDLELRALAETRRFILLRTIFLACGVLFTLLPLVFTFDERGVEFLILGRQPGLVWAFWSISVASWTACYVMNRQIRPSGL
jgi:hypothetical protein